MDSVSRFIKLSFDNSKISLIVHSFRISEAIQFYVAGQLNDSTECIVPGAGTGKSNCNGVGAYGFEVHAYIAKTWRGVSTPEHLVTCQ